MEQEVTNYSVPTGADMAPIPEKNQQNKAAGIRPPKALLLSVGFRLLIKTFFHGNYQKNNCIKHYGN